MLSRAEAQTLAIGIVTEAIGSRARDENLMSAALRLLNERIPLSDERHTAVRTEVKVLTFLDAYGASSKRIIAALRGGTA